MRLVVHPEAAAELAAAAEWYDGRRPGLGADLVSEIDRALEVLLEEPLTWPVWPLVPARYGVRRFLLPRFPFAVAYRVSADRVVVLAIAHTRRRPGYWLGRAGGG